VVVREYDVDELMTRACELWDRAAPSPLIEAGDRAWDALAEAGFDPPTAGMAVVWSDDFFPMAMALLEACALLNLVDSGASGDIDGPAREFRLASDILALWADALEERVVDELQSEAAEEAAGLGRGQELSVEEQPGWEARAAQLRSEKQALREEAFVGRQGFIDIIRMERQREVRDRIQQLRDESRRLRDDDPEPGGSE
jgi:hypothetical protein